MLRAIFSGQGDPVQIVMQILSTVFVVFCTLPIHEYAHALIATKLGDPVPRLSGRLTLSPLAHIDLFGAIMIFIAGFGYAKPVPVNMHNFKMKNKKIGMALVALAGPLSNILMAIIFLFLRCVAILLSFNLPMPDLLVTIIDYFFTYAALINVSLAVFNFIPIPPLDGSRILFSVLPDKFYFSIMRYERYIMIGMLVLLATGIVTKPLSLVSNLIFSALDSLISLPFNMLITIM